MPGWEAVLSEIQELKFKGSSALDLIRRRYLRELQAHSQRNIIAYYSAWLQRPTEGLAHLAIGDDDTNSFMTVIKGMDRSLGLDLILHTPGGDIAATESLVNYLWKMFDKNIRVIVPQLAMSAGTMIACSAKEVIMGKHSSLGPIDPQISGFPAQAIIEEFEMAVENIKKDPDTLPLWTQIFSRYPPSFLLECSQAIEWSRTMVHEWLCKNMLKGHEKQEEIAQKIINYLANHAATGTHSRHIAMEKCEEIGLKIIKLEDDPKFQDLVLTVHHAYMHTFGQSQAIKITENHQGIAMVVNQAPKS